MSYMEQQMQTLYEASEQAEKDFYDSIDIYINNNKNNRRFSLLLRTKRQIKFKVKQFTKPRSLNNYISKFNHSRI